MTILCLYNGDRNWSVKYSMISTKFPNEGSYNSLWSYTIPNEISPIPRMRFPRIRSSRSRALWSSQTAIKCSRDTTDDIEIIIEIERWFVDLESYRWPWTKGHRSNIISPVDSFTMIPYMRIIHIGSLQAIIKETKHNLFKFDLESYIWPWTKVIGQI